jgi:vacuolar iron transporter family protein
MLKDSIKKGLGFGLTSGIITTIGLMVGLYSGTNLKLAVIGGILTIAIADAFSDALGIHIAEEFEGRHTAKEIWEITASTFFFQFIFSSIFIIPVLLFELFWAIVVSIIFGMFMIGITSYKFAKAQNMNAWKATAEHLIVAMIVIIVAYYVGYWISLIFG